VEAVGDPVDATTVNEDSIRFYYNDLEKGTIVEYWLKSEDPATHKPHTVVPEIDKDKSTPATCKEPEKIWLKATIGEKVYFSETWFEGKPALGALGHDWEVQYDYESGVPSHNFDFEVKATYTCKICGESHKDVVKVEPIMHTWSEEPVYVPDLDYTDPNVKTDDDGYVVF